MSKIKTPAGVSIYPNLLEPTNFKGEGPLNYDCKLKFNLKDEGVSELISTLEEAHAKGKEGINERRAKFGEKPLSHGQLKKDAPTPWTKEEDDEGEPTGYVVVKAKLKAERMIKGSPVKQRPAVFDDKGKAWDMDTAIWGGSIIRMSVEPQPWYMAPIGGYGMTLQLRAAQVVSLVNHENEAGDAASFGFEVDDSEEVAPQVVAQKESAFDDEAFDAQDL